MYWRKKRANERANECLSVVINLLLLVSYYHLISYFFYHRFYAFIFTSAINAPCLRIHGQQKILLDPIEIYRAPRREYFMQTKIDAEIRIEKEASALFELTWNRKWAFFDATNCLMRGYCLFIMYKVVCACYNQSALGLCVSCENQWKFSNYTYVTILESIHCDMCWIWLYCVNVCRLLKFATLSPSFNTCVHKSLSLSPLLAPLFHHIYGHKMTILITATYSNCALSLSFIHALK